MQWFLMWLVALISSHKLAIGTVGMLWFTAGVVTMPNPDEPFRLYPWLYAWIHQFLNLVDQRRKTTTLRTPEGTLETSGPVIHSPSEENK